MWTTIFPTRRWKWWKFFSHATDYLVFNSSFVNLGNVFSSLTGHKFDILFLLDLPLSSGINDAVLLYSGKTFCAILVLIAFVSNGVKKSAENFTSWRGIVWMPPFFYILIFQVFNFIFIDRFEWKSFSIRNIESIDYSFNFNNAWMIFVGIDNISNIMYAGGSKICAKGFWFSSTAFFNNIYVITSKKFCQLFFIGDNFVFMNKCLSLFPMKPFICKKRLCELPEALIGC